MINKALEPLQAACIPASMGTASIILEASEIGSNNPKIAWSASLYSVQEVFHKLTKREMAAYTILLDMGEADLGIALDLLSSRICTTKRTARRIVKRLKRLGLLRLYIKHEKIIIYPIPPSEVLHRATEEYLAWRRERCYAYSKRNVEEEGQHGR